jgi:hypothetical protein
MCGLLLVDPAGSTQNQEVTTLEVVTFFWCQFGARIWMKMECFERKNELEIFLRRQVQLLANFDVAKNR